MKNRMNSSLSFKSSWCKIASTAMNWINSVPHTTATTFAFSSVFNLLLWPVCNYCTVMCMLLFFTSSLYRDICRFTDIQYYTMTLPGLRDLSLAHKFTKGFLKVSQRALVFSQAFYLSKDDTTSQDSCCNLSKLRTLIRYTVHYKKLIWTEKIHLVKSNNITLTCINWVLLTKYVIRRV